MQKRIGLGPVDAGVRNALSVDKLIAKRLCPGYKIAFNHDTLNTALTVGDLFCDVTADQALFAMIFAAVCMAAIDHDVRRNAGLFHLLCGGSDGCCVVVGDLPTSTQNNVAVRIARGKKDG